jgi:antitoxin component YwqK of YwqJK toxin-antitoxin module
MKRLEMKRLLLPLTLTLAASASALAQTGGLERRDGDVFVGPVRTARVETARYVKQDGALVEGPRRLSASASYSEDGKRSEQEEYAEDGTMQQRIVHVYDDAGRLVEQEIYDGRGGLTAKVVSRPDAGEVVTYGPDGKLQQRVVTVRGENGVTETKTYDASGALLERGMLAHGDGGAVAKTYDANGTLRRETTARRVEDGGHSNEEQRYGANGAPVARRVATVGAGSGDVDVSVERPRGTQFEKTRVTREYDSRGNVVKSVSYVWDKAAGDLVPSEVNYYTVTYYR